MTITAALITFLIAFPGAGFIATRFCLRCTPAYALEIAWLTFAPTCAFIVTIFAVMLAVPGAVTPNDLAAFVPQLATVYLNAVAFVWPSSGLIMAILSFTGAQVFVPSLAFACRCSTGAVLPGIARAKSLPTVPDHMEPSDS